MKMMPWPVGLPASRFICNARPVRDHALAVRDDGNVMVALDLEGVGLEGIRLAAAAHGRIVGLRRDWSHWRMLAGESLYRPLSRAAAGAIMASVAKAARRGFMTNLDLC
jgi:hypothetical protein